MEKKKSKTKLKVVHLERKRKVPWISQQNHYDFRFTKIRDQPDLSQSPPEARSQTLTSPKKRFSF